MYVISLVSTVCMLQAVYKKVKHVAMIHYSIMHGKTVLSPSAELSAPTFVVTASSTNTTVGQSLILTCSVTTAEGLVWPPEVEFLGPSNPLTSGDGVTVGSTTTEGAVSTAKVEFETLGTADGGRYTCRATVSVPGIEDVQSETGIDVFVRRELM